MDFGDLGIAVNIAARPLLLLCAIAFAILSACSSDDPPAPPEPTQQEQSQPQAEQPAQLDSPAQQQEAPSPPTRPAADPAQVLADEADALERNGFWEAALQTRDSAIAASGIRAPLQLDQVRLLLRLNRPQDAGALIEQIGPLGNAELVRRRNLLQARTALELGQTDAAVEAMAAYVNSDSAAWAVISLEAARTLQRAGRGADAIEWVERALGGSLPTQDRLRALHLAATELDIAGEAERALEHYQALLEESPWRDDQAAALSRIAALADADTALAARQRLINEFPSFAESWQALDELLAADADVPDLTIGRIRFEQQRWQDARFWMLNVLGSSDDLAERVEAEFWIAAIHEANNDRQSAALGYVAVIERDRSHPLAAESAMRLAEFAQSDGDGASAESYWQQVLNEHPQHARAPEAARRWALSALARGEWLEASTRFAEGATIFADHDTSMQQELLYWAALTASEAGQAEASAGLAAEAAELDPVAYYGLRAAQLANLEPPAPLPIPIDTWLLRLSGEEPQASTPASAVEWRAARDLRLGGFDDAADRMLLHWIERAASSPADLVAIARFLADQHEVSASARAAERAWRWFGLNWSEAPVELVRLAYPQPWSDVMALYAAEQDVDPLLIWSLIRRESFYDPDAEGLAGEVGLTQVIPLTGGDIADGLGVEYEHQDLARPQLAIRFGAWYLARQLEGFSNEPVMALAAYNAGPGNAARWESAALLAGADGFLAAMDFASTRTYVRYVIEAHAAYEALETAEEAP